MCFLAKIRLPLSYLNIAFVACALALPAMAQEIRPITAEENGLACTYAKDKSWADFASYAERIDVELGTLQYQVVCRMAASTANPYEGNIWSASARYSGFIGDFVRYSTRYLLKDNSQHDIWVALVTGGNVPSESPSVFVELVTAWENIPNKRADLEIAARTICLSIDRFNVQGLENIRANECMTPPFVFPPRAE